MTELAPWRAHTLGGRSMVSRWEGLQCCTRVRRGDKEETLLEARATKSLGTDMTDGRQPFSQTEHTCHNARIVVAFGKSVQLRVRGLASFPFSNGCL